MQQKTAIKEKNKTTNFEITKTIKINKLTLTLR